MCDIHKCARSMMQNSGWDLNRSWAKCIEPVCTFVGRDRICGEKYLGQICRQALHILGSEKDFAGNIWVGALKPGYFLLCSILGPTDLFLGGDFFRYMWSLRIFCHCGQWIFALHVLCTGQAFRPYRGHSSCFFHSGGLKDEARTLSLRLPGTVRETHRRCWVYGIYVHFKLNGL